MQDYTSNSNKSKEQATKASKPVAKAEKKVDKVVVGEVVVQKKSLSRRFKDIFVAADLKGVVAYVTQDVLLPSARQLIVDTTVKGVERAIYGDSTPRPRYGPVGSRITYNNPINRSYSDPRARPQVPSRPTSRRRSEDYILSSRQEAEEVVERMNDVIDTYEVASIADLHDLLGERVNPVDHKWGWVYLGDAQVRQTREGYLLDLPPAEPIH